DVLVVVTHAEAARRARVARLAEVLPVAVEHLYALVRAVGDVDVTLSIGNDRVRHVELSRPLALAAPGAEEISIGVELEDARLALAMARRHVDLAVRPEREIVGLVEAAQMARVMPFSRVALDAQYHENAALRGHLEHEMPAGVG